MAILLTMIGVNVHFHLSENSSFSVAQNSYVEPGTLSRDFSVIDAVRYNGYQFTSWYNEFPLVVRISYMIVVSSILVWIFTIIKIFVDQWFDYRKERIFNALYKKYHGVQQEILYEQRNMTIREIREKMGLPETYATSTQQEIDFWLKLYVKDYVYRTRRINRFNEAMMLRVLHIREYMEHVLLDGSTKNRINVMETARYLNIQMNGGLVARLINDKNEDLKREARLFYMFNTYDEPFEIINREVTFTLWDQMEIHLMTMKAMEQGKPVPSFFSQIENNHNPVNKAFLIQEAGYFGLEENIRYLMKYLNSTDERIFRAAVKCFTERAYEPAVENIKANYRRWTPHTRRLILRSLLKIHEGNNMEDFFVWAYSVSPDFKTKRVVLRCLWEYSLKGKKAVVTLRRQAPTKELILFHHIQNDILRATEIIKL